MEWIDICGGGTFAKVPPPHPPLQKLLNYGYDLIVCAFFYGKIFFFKKARWDCFHARVILSVAIAEPNCGAAPSEARWNLGRGSIILLQLKFSLTIRRAENNQIQSCVESKTNAKSKHTALGVSYMPQGRFIQINKEPRRILKCVGIAGVQGNTPDTLFWFIFCRVAKNEHLLLKPTI